MNHAGMDHSGMDHSSMDHSGMDHSGMDHSGMDHSAMDHGAMDHSGHNIALTVVNTTAQAIVDAVTTGINMAVGSANNVDHISHIGHSEYLESAVHSEHDGHGMMDMSMSFHFGYKETILFSWWKIHNIGGLIGSMIGIFILALLYEGLKYWREHLFRKAIATLQYCANLQKGNATEDNKASHMNMLSLDHGLQTLLHVLQMIVSYFLMLIFMTYNVWLCIAVVLGAGVGYFLFGWRKSVVVDITEHCH